MISRVTPETASANVDRQVVAQVGAGHHPPAPRVPAGDAAEERVEDVAERPEPAAEAARTARARPVHPAVAEHVVRGSALPVGQDAVRLVQLLEARLGAIGGVDVRGAHAKLS